MFGLQWNERLSGKSRHPMADASHAARLIRALPRENPTNAVAEGAAWLESIEAESFVPNHRLQLVSMIDEAVNASVAQLALVYIGAAPGNAGLVSDWRLLIDYLDRLSAGYGLVVDASTERRHADLAPRVPLAIVRMMRAVTLSMKVSWLRYLPPDRASWETLVRCFRTARSRAVEATMVKAYAPDAPPTCALHELAVGVMLAAAAPQSLVPRQVEIAYRIAVAHRSRFTVTARHDSTGHCCLFDLDNAGPPVRIPEQAAASGDRLLFSAGRVLSELASIVESGRGGGLALMPEMELGREFGAGEKLSALEHVSRFWGDNPPLRRGERTRINTRIQVEVGARALCGALDAVVDEARLDFTRPGVAEEATRVAALNTWTLTDFSSRGIGARFSRRLDRWLKVGSLVAFRLERSENWCLAIVRRLRTDPRNQTDVGCEILSKDAKLVQIETLSAHASAIMLPEDAQLEARSSLLLEPGTHAPGQNFVMREGGIERRIRLGAVIEAIDGWNRVEFAPA